MIKVPSPWFDEKEQLRRLADAVNSTIDGSGNNAGSVTLAENVTTTVVADKRVGVDSVIVFMPTTVSAATEFGLGKMYISARPGDGTFTITHENLTATDRDFDYAVLATTHSTGRSL
tara:strand:+ start:1932 stop:2282 length:351 start_codon:yes stop_codon:yes gene_type:complete